VVMAAKELVVMVFIGAVNARYSHSLMG